MDTTENRNSPAVDAAYTEILNKWKKRNNDIIEKAKQNGTWLPGLDSNEGMFTDSKKQFMEDLEELKDKVRQGVI